MQSFSSQKELNEPARLKFIRLFLRYQKRLGVVKIPKLLNYCFVVVDNHFGVLTYIQDRFISLRAVLEILQ